MTRSPIVIAYRSATIYVNNIEMLSSVLSHIENSDAASQRSSTRPTISTCGSITSSVQCEATGSLESTAVQAVPCVADKASGEDPTPREDVGVQTEDALLGCDLQTIQETLQTQLASQLATHKKALMDNYLARYEKSQQQNEKLQSHLNDATAERDYVIQRFGKLADLRNSKEINSLHDTPLSSEERVHNWHDASHVNAPLNDAKKVSSVTDSEDSDPNVTQPAKNSRPKSKEKKRNRFA
eukprot:TRINITY_DN32337_c0_g1_i1.p1 TRINITY_DN32337_c0_g1~~TRINITY_DN32337_c0_g1_i1.p1  ORF type:complete len:240 (+),score=32.63 TRINITY_DN32337_c0_g1_i1:71-790(+)